MTVRSESCVLCPVTDSLQKVSALRQQPPRLIARTLRLRAILLVALAVVASSPLAAFAAETATIVNQSDLSVEYFLKWSNVPFESGKLVLAPGEVRSVSGPDGARLDIRFNSTPGGGPPREVRYQVVTVRSGCDRTSEGASVNWIQLVVQENGLRAMLWVCTNPRHLRQGGR